MAKENKILSNYNILCLDGGGMRGLYTASLLHTLSKRFGTDGDVGKNFNMIVGTSTGGILAAGLAAGVSIENIIDIYLTSGHEIFSNAIPAGSFRKMGWVIKSRNSSANNNTMLREVLTTIFKTENLEELYNRRKIGLCIPAINLATHQPVVFKTPHNPVKNSDNVRLLVDICLATSAAPIILPIAGIPDPDIPNQYSHYVDGGLWANNPVLIGLIEALNVTEEATCIQIISIGTCPPPGGMSILPEEEQRGVLGWNFGIKALEISMDAQASGHQFMANFIIDYLNKCGRKVTLLRLRQTSPSSDQAEYLGLDNAGNRACSILKNLGAHDARMAYGEALKANNEYNVLTDVFGRTASTF